MTAVALASMLESFEAPEAMKVLRIKHWNEGFENATSRKLKSPLPWVAIPTKHDGKGYRKLIRHANGVAFYGVWVLLVAVAAKSKLRGCLVDDDGPLSDEDLSIKTDAPADLIGQAVAHLVENIGWLEWVEVDSLSRLLADNPNTVADDASTVGNSADTRRTEQNITCLTERTDGSGNRKGVEERLPVRAEPTDRPKSGKRANSVFWVVKDDTLKNPHLLKRWFTDQQGNSKNRALDPRDPDAWLFCVAAAEHCLGEADCPPALFTTIVGGKNREMIDDKYWRKAEEIVREFPLLTGAA